MFRNGAVPRPGRSGGRMEQRHVELRSAPPRMHIMRWLGRWAPFACTYVNGTKGFGGCRTPPADTACNSLKLPPVTVVRCQELLRHDAGLAPVHYGVFNNFTPLLLRHWSTARNQF